MFRQVCGREGRRTHLIKGSGQFDVEVVYLCNECRIKYENAIKRVSAEDLTLEEKTEKLNQFRQGKLFMSEITNNKILIPLTSENQRYVENVCTNGGYTFQTFFEHLLSLYKRSLNEPLAQLNAPIAQSNEPAESQELPEERRKKTMPNRKH